MLRTITLALPYIALASLGAANRRKRDITPTARQGTPAGEVAWVMKQSRAPNALGTVATLLLKQNHATRHSALLRRPSSDMHLRRAEIFMGPPKLPAWRRFIERTIVVPDIRPWIHSDNYMGRKLQRLQSKGVKFNHEYAGLTCELETDLDGNACPKGFELRRKRVWLGKGEEVFGKATNLMRSFSMINGLDWAKMAVVGQDQKNVSDSDPNLRKGDMVATAVKCYGLLWSFNPCRIVCNDVDRPGYVELEPSRTVRVSQVAFSTVRGHLIAGEERFRVIFDPEGEGNVYFEALSFTRGAGLVGAIAMPFIRPLQRFFFNDITRKMQEITLVTAVAAGSRAQNVTEELDDLGSPRSLNQDDDVTEE